MVSKREKRIKKVTKAKVLHREGQLYMIQGTVYEVRYINQGNAWLGVHFDNEAEGRFRSTLDKVINEYARLPDGQRVYRATPEQVLEAEAAASPVEESDDSWLSERSYAV